MKTKTKVTLVSFFLSLILLAAPVFVGPEQFPFFFNNFLKKITVRSKLLFGYGVKTANRIF